MHRDFKPSNVLVGRDGRPRVVDFGLARLGDQGTASVELPSALSGQHRTLATAAATTESATASDREPGGQAASSDATGQAAADAAPAEPSGSPAGSHSVGSDRVTRIGSISGTPGYMSPEQYIGGDVDSLSDQFSFCAALFEALYGFLPFPGETLEELAASVSGPVRTPPPSSKVPIEVHRAILRGLSTHPEDRFPDMGALLAALGVEHGHSAAAGALSRQRLLSSIASVALVLGAVIALRVAQRTMSTRDAALSSVVLLLVTLAAGGLHRQTLLSNKFHRRAYLLVLLGITQNLLQRTAGFQLGWQMKQLFPFEMIVWAGVGSALIGLGLRSLLPLPFFLISMAGLVTLWQDIPKPAMLFTYVTLVGGVAWAWLRVGRSASPAVEQGTSKSRHSSGSRSRQRSAVDSSPSSPSLRPARPSPPPSGRGDRRSPSAAP